EVNVAGDRTRTGALWHELCVVPCFERSDVPLGEPDRNFNGDGGAVVDERDFLQRLMPQLVVADRRNDEGGDVRRCILLTIDDDARDVCEFGVRLRRALALMPSPQSD